MRAMSCDHNADRSPVDLNTGIGGRSGATRFPSNAEDAYAVTSELTGDELVGNAARGRPVGREETN